MTREVTQGHKVGTCEVGVIELGDANDLGSLGPAFPLELFILLELGPVHDIIHHTRLLHLQPIPLKTPHHGTTRVNQPVPLTLTCACL